MLQPKRRKYRKEFRGRNKGVAKTRTSIDFGEYGLKAVERGRIESKALEAARKKITFMTKRTGKYWVRVFPDLPVTKKPIGVKMGSGKGAVDHYEVKVRPGTVLFELSGVDEKLAREAFLKAAYKLPIKTRFVCKDRL
ncbi:MAG TPA: 50S ribosomal protein L16 [Candidatus Woesebacteria bacterium]|nr:50S ribosomal protein L16 [Candidatus Woesebacteria bacterium]